jgi:hypothetical protein
LVPLAKEPKVKNKPFLCNTKKMVLIILHHIPKCLDTNRLSVVRVLKRALIRQGKF